MQVNELFRQSNTILLDGGMGTMLQAAGLKLGARPEELNITDPAQERDRPAGGQRPPGKRTTGRVRPLRAAHPLRIQKEGKDLCK